MQDGVTGLLYEPDNIEDFCDKAASVLLDPQKRELLEKNAIRRAKELSWERISQKMEELLKLYQ